MISPLPTHERLANFQHWISRHLSENPIKLTPLAGDASFRQYFRIKLHDKTFIAVDAPPELENSHSFVALAKVFAKQGLKVPEVIQADLDQGFMLQTDLGDNLFFHVLNSSNVDRLYKQALEKLLLIQSCHQDNGWHFPIFDFALFAEELKRFQHWYLLTHLQLNLTEQTQTLLTETFQALIQSALSQPQLCVHRDYHSRNLLQLADGDLGIIDFQDALMGPITYDVVSLLRDCYLAWPPEQVEEWALFYYELAVDAALLPAGSSQQFLRWFDWMGIQRHLKAIYIFARKWHRDGNDIYLNDIPRTLNYVLEVSAKYPELTEFRRFLSGCV
ncbi:MAG TPA: phosphotransferase [Gammaproteobacteria bacterium]|nr:phosphotransferase [Gammaproteobacteria bacterium]